MYGDHHDLFNRYGINDHGYVLFYRNHILKLSSFITFHCVCYKNNTTSAMHWWSRICFPLRRTRVHSQSLVRFVLQNSSILYIIVCALVLFLFVIALSVLRFSLQSTPLISSNYFWTYTQNMRIFLHNCYTIINRRKNTWTHEYCPKQCVMFNCWMSEWAISNFLRNIMKRPS